MTKMATALACICQKAPSTRRCIKTAIEVTITMHGVRSESTQHQKVH